MMGHGVGHYIGLNGIGSPSPMKTFITINYLFNFIFLNTLYALSKKLKPKTIKQNMLKYHEY